MDCHRRTSAGDFAVTSREAHCLSCFASAVANLLCTVFGTLPKRAFQRSPSTPRTGTGGVAANIRLVSAATPGSYLIRSGDFVYWTEKRAAPNGKLRRYEFAHPNAVAQDVVTGLDSPEGIATDGTWLYFKQNDAMYRVGMCGGTPQQLSPVVPANDSQATEISAVDSTYVYFVAGPGFGDSKIYRVAK